MKDLGPAGAEGVGGAVGMGLGGRIEAPRLLRAFIARGAGAIAAIVSCCRGAQSTAVLCAPVVFGA